jgi:regulator of sirC expression with transglutaminase-like and TPR domain
MPTVRDRFTKAVKGPEESMDLGEISLLVAAEEYPNLDVDRYLCELDEIAATAPADLRRGASQPDRAAALVRFLSVERGFRGNDDDYYDRRNSFLNEVLDRKKGIPITLAIVYVEVAKRLDLPVAGVGFPGHFLAKLTGDEEVIIDPFFGRILDEKECEQRLRSVLGENARFDPSYLRATGPRQIVIRMLSNLKQIHLRARDITASLRCSERILLVDENLTFELRDRGLLYFELECFSAAQADLERFCELAPENETAQIREKLIEARARAELLH